MHFSKPNNARTTLLTLLAWASLTASSVLFAADQRLQKPAAEAGAMTLGHMEDIIKRLDSNYERDQGMFTFVYADRSIRVVTDENADRMRVIIPIIEAASLNEAALLRLLQANFDSALDARYAVAQGVLWSTFIHRLSSLDDRDFLSGIGQTINTAESFGTSYSSGELVYGGGDSGDILRRDLIDQLQSEGTTI